MRISANNAKKIAAIGITAALAGGVLAGCSTGTDSGTTAKDTAATEQTAEGGSDEVETIQLEDVQMRYISPEDTEANLDNEDYLIIDLRKAADYESAHIPGSINADLSCVVEGNDTATGVAVLTSAVMEATGSETGEGKTLVLVCYSGNKYAQAGTNILDYLGADMSNVYTLEGGMKAWTGETE